MSLQAPFFVVKKLTGAPSKPIRFFAKELEAILKLSVMYSALDVWAFAVSELSSPKLAASPAHLLSLSVKYRVPEWYEPNFVRLAQKPLHILSPIDLGLIPPLILQRLLFVRYNVDFGRRILLRTKPAFYRERITSPACSSDNNSCARGILVLWDTIVEPLLMDQVWLPARPGREAGRLLARRTAGDAVSNPDHAA